MTTELWCKHQSPDDDRYIECLAYLVEGRVLSCPYSSIEDRQGDRFPCSDYDPLPKDDAAHDAVSPTWDWSGYVCKTAGLPCCGCSLFCEHRAEKR